MKASRIAATGVIGLAALASAPAAWACEFTQTPWGLRLTNCNLKTLYQGRYDLALDQNPLGPRLRLSNLRATHADAGLIDKTAVLTVDLQNDGIGNAGQFEVAVMSSINNPLTGGTSVGMVVQPPVVVSSLAGGARVLLAPGHVELPNRSQDWDICTVVVVDPPAGSRPHGSVFESNESDNQWSGCCRAPAGSSATCQ